MVSRHTSWGLRCQAGAHFAGLAGGAQHEAVGAKVKRRHGCRVAAADSAPPVATRGRPQDDAAVGPARRERGAVRREGDGGDAA